MLARNFRKGGWTDFNRIPASIRKLFFLGWFLSRRFVLVALGSKKYVARGAARSFDPLKKRAIEKHGERVFFGASFSGEKRVREGGKTHSLVRGKGGGA